MPQILQSRLRRAPSKPHLALWRAKQTANLNLWKSHGYYFRRLQFQSRFGTPLFEKKGKSLSFFNNSYFPQGAPEASGRARPARPRASLVQFEGFFLSFFNTFVFVEKVKKTTRRLTAVAAKAGFALHFLLYYLLYIIALNEYHHLRVLELLLFPEPQPRPACPTFWQNVRQNGLACGWGKSDGFEDVTFWYKTGSFTL